MAVTMETFSIPMVIHERIRILRYLWQRVSLIVVVDDDVVVTFQDCFSLKFVRLIERFLDTWPHCIEQLVGKRILLVLLYLHDV